MQRCKAVLSGWLGIAVVGLLIVGSAGLRADDKKKTDSPPQRSAPAPEQHRSAPAPAPAVRPEPAGRQPATNNQGPQGRNPGGYSPNNNPNNTPNNTPNNGRQSVYQPNTTTNPNPDRGHPGGYQPNNNPNPNNSRQNVYQPNVYQPNNNPNPNNGRQNVYQPNNTPNPNNGRQNVYQPNNNGRQSVYQPNTNQNNGRTFTTGRTRDGGEIRPLAGGRAEYRGPNNARAEFRRDGSVHEVQARGMVITHGPVGTRRVVMERSDHTRIVTYGRQSGYVQRTYTVSGREYYHRTYYVGGAAYTRVYRPYRFGGVAYYGYVPSAYYRPAFYGWAYSPWPGPVFYRWGWGGSPWYGYYGGYFSPYPSYPGAGPWLTDYMISANLQDAYQQQMDANADMGGRVDYQGGITPDIKQDIADEVQRQLAQERAESQNPQGDPSAPPPFADNGPHYFVVSTSLDAGMADGQTCPVTAGDVLGMNGAPPPDARAANVRVLASKGQDCPQGSVVAVSLEDLQEMQNRMREVIDRGLGELQARQGQGGLPVIPAQARGQVQSPSAAAAPPPDANAATELTQQDQQASQAEQEIVNQAATDPMPQPQQESSPSVILQAPPMNQSTLQAPLTISLGQTPDQVIAILGQPKQMVDLGAKKMFVYTDMKIIFMDGKVTDVQ